VARRITFWSQALTQGAGSLNTAAGWLSLVVLLLGIAAGITVPLVYNVSWWVTAIVGMAVLVLVLLEGSYRVWNATDEQRKLGQTALEAAEAKPTAPSLRNFVAGGSSQLSLRSSAPILAEGGGLADYARLDADHHPGNLRAFARPVESNHGQEEPQPEAKPQGETHS
jgi:hypothetical protein